MPKNRVCTYPAIQNIHPITHRALPESSLSERCLQCLGGERPADGREPKFQVGIILGL